MKLSQNGLDLIKSFEGVVLSAYKAVDTELYWTIGFGHYGPDVKQGQRISNLEAEQLLRKDVVKFENEVNKHVKIAINQNQFDALVSFTYNVGGNAFANSTLLKLINKKDFVGASKEFARWNKSSGVVLKGLVKRREAERVLFVKPVPKKLKVDGIAGKETIKELQRFLKVKVDGDLGKETIKALQLFLNNN